MASERQMPHFHFEAEFPHKQNCFHLRLCAPSHPIRALSEEHIFKIWMECITCFRLGLDGSWGVTTYFYFFEKFRKCRKKFLKWSEMVLSPFTYSCKRHLDIFISAFGSAYIDVFCIIHCKLIAQLHI